MAQERGKWGGSFVRGNELWVCIKCREILDHINSYYVSLFVATILFIYLFLTI